MSRFTKYDEKKKLALKQFEQLNEDSYKTKLKLDQENDEFLKYAENCIRDYHKQGKDITPLLLELKRYKKTATLCGSFKFYLSVFSYFIVCRAPAFVIGLVL